MNKFNHPDVYELTEWFEVLPSSENFESILYFNLEDQHGTSLCFSVDTINASIQTIVGSKKRNIVTVSQERANSIRLQRDHGKDMLIAEFSTADSIIHLNLIIRPDISVNWFGLSKE